MNIISVNKDIEIAQPPPDTVSQLEFSPQVDYLAAASWDNNVRIWEIQKDGSSVGKSMYSHEGPALCCAWSSDGTKLVSGGADKAARMMDIVSGTTVQVAAHDEPIRNVRFVEAPNSAPILATAGWDKKLKYWDLRAQNPVITVDLPERCYAMDSLHPLLVVGTANRQMLIFDLNNPGTPFRTYTSPLKYQTKAVSCFLSKNGYALGSIEGRIAIQYAQEAETSKNFTYKCHRQETNVYSVNCITHHPTFGTFGTGGSDGNIIFWDREAKTKLGTISNVGAPVTSSSFNRTGDILAYSVGYDWSKGYQSSFANIKVSKNIVGLSPNGVFDSNNKTLVYDQFHDLTQDSTYIVENNVIDSRLCLLPNVILTTLSQ
ncbi:hypothetical protein BB561_006020 [Smittium simulii]|uniref:Uncharacterized protein n=1 Tax=Smittium simulii TaxID=133385 RepID=A0A2T9Y705_9FUNG|nr:hypothetical protein BB561_006020 [Smittium simulii]